MLKAVKKRTVRFVLSDRYAGWRDRSELLNCGWPWNELSHFPGFLRYDQLSLQLPTSNPQYSPLLSPSTPTAAALHACFLACLLACNRKISTTASRDFRLSTLDYFWSFDKSIIVCVFFNAFLSLLSP